MEENVDLKNTDPGAEGSGAEGSGSSELSNVFKEVSDLIKSQAGRIEELQKEIKEIKEKSEIPEDIPEDDFKTEFEKFKEDVKGILQAHNRGTGGFQMEPAQPDFDTINDEILKRRF